MSRSARAELEQAFRRANRLDHAITFLNWDQMVMMPAGGLEARSESLAELSGLRQELLQCPEIVDRLAQFKVDASDEESRAAWREMARVWRQQTCVPVDLSKAQIHAGAKCEHAWREQRHHNDWAGFLPNWREVVALARQEAQCRQAAATELSTPYDAMLELHCTGDDSALIEQQFAPLRRELPTLLDAVIEHQASRPWSPPVPGPFPLAAQKTLSEQLMDTLGFDFSSGRLDVSTHPFSTGDTGDQRITTRYHQDSFLDALMATAHETGHASYEAGRPLATRGLPVGEARNMCVHESQSLLYEKHIFLNRSFLSHMAGHAATLLPASAGWSAGQWWLEASRVQRSLIRVEADEVSYPLHVMLRFDIERALINDELQAEDVPDAWDEGMQSLLGISTVGDYTNGCLQDIHWTDGAFGYFPSYTMGAINAAQIANTLSQKLPDWHQQLKHGQTAELRAWLAKNVWSQGCTLESQALLQQATGKGTDAYELLKHLRRRYLEDAY